MPAIKQLERLIEPYWIGGGASSSFTDYNEYRHNGVTARLDEEDWWLARNPQPLYKKALERVVKELGLED